MKCQLRKMTNTSEYFVTRGSYVARVNGTHALFKNIDTLFQALQTKFIWNYFGKFNQEILGEFEDYEIGDLREKFPEYLL